MTFCVSHLKHAIITVCILGLLCGCASLNTQTGSTDTPVKTSAEHSQNRLSPQQLLPGECGLFVWTQDEARRFIVFSRASEQTGVWNHEGQDIDLTITNEDVRDPYQQAGRTTYETPTGESVTLSLFGGTDIGDGMRYPSGSLSFSNQEGWDVVMPVSAFSSCRPELDDPTG